MPSGSVQAPRGKNRWMPLGERAPAVILSSLCCCAVRRALIMRMGRHFKNLSNWKTKMHRFKPQRRSSSLWLFLRSSSESGECAASVKSTDAGRVEGEARGKIQCCQLVLPPWPRKPKPSTGWLSSIPARGFHGRQTVFKQPCHFIPWIEGASLSDPRAQLCPRAPVCSVSKNRVLWGVLFPDHFYRSQRTFQPCGRALEPVLVFRVKTFVTSNPACCLLGCLPYGSGHLL